MRPGQGRNVLPRIQSNGLKNFVFPGEIACPFIPAEKALATDLDSLSAGTSTVEITSVTAKTDWTQAVGTKAAQNVKVTVNMKEAVSSGETVMVDIFNSEGDRVTSGETTITGDGLETSFDETIQVLDSYSTVAGVYTVVAKSNASTNNTATYNFTVYPAATSPADAFANGTAVAGVNQDGFAIEPVDGVFSIPADGKNPRYAIPTSVMPQGATQAVDVVLAGKTDPNDTEYYKNFFTDNNGEPNTGTNVADIDALATPGTYWVKVKPAADETAYPQNAELYVKFVVSASSLDGAVAYVKNADDAFDTSKTDIVYDGKDYADRIGFAIGGVPVDATAAFYDATGKAVGGNGVIDAGSYSAVLSGTGAYANASATVRFEVKQLDLTTAQLAVEDFAYTGGTMTVDAIDDKATVNGDPVTDFTSGIVFSAGPVAKVGSYTATFSAADNQKNVINSGTASFNVVSKILGDSAYKYGNSDLDTAVDNQVFGTGRNAFDINDVWVEDDNIDEGDYTVTLTNADGDEVESATASGRYTLTVSVKPGADYALGGSKTVHFTVSSGSLAAAEVTFTYKGAVYGGDPIPYTGKNVLDDIQVTVKLGRNTLVEGTDYELVVTDDAKEQVEEAVDAGNYTMSIKGINYTGTISQGLQISQATIKALRVQTGATNVLPWTGEAVTPVIEFTTDGEWDVVAKDEDGIATAYGWVIPDNAEWQVLPADQYIATYFDKDGKKVDASEVVDAGKYTVEVALNSLAKNVTWASEGTVPNSEAKNPVDRTATFTIAKAATFADVSADAWYADAVALAASDGYGYMTGIPGTNLFMPEGDITRAQTAQVLYNMAGGVNDQDGTYPSKFSDVDAKAWYALPVLWASEAGIVTGYGDTGAFGPDDQVTREQAATMLWRYVKAQGKDVSATADLSGYADGASVSDWAAEAMQWAVANDVFGVNTDTLRPQESLSRAEMAAIAVRVQPDGAIKSIQ